MFSRKKDLLKDGERFFNNELSKLHLPKIEYAGRIWSFGNKVNGVAYVEGKLDSGVAAKGVLRIYEVESEGQRSYAVVRIMFVNKKQYRVYVLAVEGMLSDATAKFNSKTMEIVDSFNSSEDNKELLRSRLREEQEV